jgi:peptidoglycan hydrolase CwlO-like protein
MAKLYLLVIVVGIFSAIGYGAKSYYEWSEATISTLRENNVKLASAAETLQNTVDQMVADAQRNEELNQNLTKQLAESREYLNTLRNKFARIDLTMEALQDPENLEERVQRAVDRLIQDIAEDTTAPGDDSSTDGVRDEDTGTDSSSSD